MPYALSIAVVSVLVIFSWIYQRILFYKNTSELLWDRINKEIHFKENMQCNAIEPLNELNKNDIPIEEIQIDKSLIRDHDTLASIEKYNSHAENYNKLVIQFPGNILASLGSHQPKTKLILKD